MKIGIIACENGECWGGEQGISQLIIKRFKEIDTDAATEYVPFFAVSRNLPKNDELAFFDGFVISGSHHSVNSNQKWVAELIQFVQTVMNSDQGPRLFGICFGHQLIAKALKGKVEDVSCKKYIYGTESVLIHDELRSKSFYTRVFNGSTNTLKIMQSHGECVTVLPTNAVCVGHSATCKNEVLLYGNKALSIQGHPELTSHEMINKILPRLRKKEVFSKEEEKMLLDTLNNQDQMKLMEFVKNFLCT